MTEPTAGPGAEHPNPDQPRPHERIAGAPSAQDDRGGPRPGRRRRRRQVTARSHRVNTTFDQQEWAALSAAAAAGPGGGWSVGAYLAATAVAIARGQVNPLAEPLLGAVQDLATARAQLRVAAGALNHVVAALNTTGRPTPALGAAVARCEAAVAQMAGAAERITATPPTCKARARG